MNHIFFFFSRKWNVSHFLFRKWNESHFDKEWIHNNWLKKWGSLVVILPISFIIIIFTFFRELKWDDPTIKNRLIYINIIKSKNICGPRNKIRKIHDTWSFSHKLHICFCDLLILRHLDAIKVRQIIKGRSLLFRDILGQCMLEIE